MTEDDVRVWVDEQEAAFVLGMTKAGTFLLINGETPAVIALLGMGIAELIKEAGIEPEEMGKMLNKIVGRQMEEKYGA